MNGDSGDSTVQSSEPVRSVENEGSGEPLFKKPVENGLSNGVSSGSDKPKSSSSSDKHRSSSSHKSSHSDKHKSSGSSDKHRSSSSSDKHRSSSSSDKHRSSSSSDKHRSDKHKSSSSDKHRSSSSHKSSSHDKHRSSSSHKSSSGSSSDKHKSSSSSSSHKSSSSGSHKSSSGSSSDKHKSSSSSSHKSSSSSDRPKSSSSHKSSSSEKVKTEVKIEPVVKSEPVEVKEEAPDSDDDVPLGARAVEPPVRSPPRVKQEKRYKEDSEEEDDDDDTPLSARAPPPKKFKQEKVKKRKADSDSEDEYTPVKKKKEVKVKKEPMSPPVKKPSKTPTKTPTKSPTKAPTKGKKGKKQEEEGERWKWWEEDHQDDGTKWHFLEHKGVLFAPEYEPLPDHVEFKYNGKAMKLTPETEEVATFYGRMLDHDYTTKEVFNKNFMKDWRKVMTKEEKETITDLTKCDFRQILAHFKEQSEKRKAMSKEEKKVIKEQNAAIQEEYGFCTMDGHKEKIGNFRIEPPGLFRGRGDHPKMGMHKRRVLARDVIINCSKDAEVPAPPPGQKWKEIRHDNSVSWLASWTENIQNSTKYVMLNASSKLKGQKDWQKYETARKLHKCADKIRAQYQMDWKSKEMRIRQRAVAMYFIDKLALRAGNEKDEGESADTVGCCSLRVEHITLHEEKDGKDYVVEFDFLGKDSIRYNNSVPVEKRVYKNLMLFMDNKSPEDDLFDRLNTATLNKHLQGLMDGLTAKVFRTYNASKTLSEQLQLLTNEEDTVAAKLLSYNRANRAVAILCNHQRAAPKNFDKQMENMQVKIDDKKKAIKTCKKELKAVKAEYKATGSDKARNAYERKKKQQERLEEQLDKLNVALTDKDENKEIALGTSKLNYLDPRISIAWCKKWDVPVEKIYNKTQRDKFTWAMDMADEDFVF